MARWNPWRRTKTDEPDISKGAGVPAAATFTPAQVAALLGSVSVNGQVTGVMNPLPRTDPMVAFGPGVPLIPAPLDPVRQDTGRPEPRLTEYQVSTNVPGITDRLVPWKVLRDAAGVGGLARRCIEIRKNEVATLDWTITIEQGAAEKAQADNPGLSRAEVEAELGRRLGPDIARCTQFWEEPNPREGENFSEWISKLLEEHLVLDALAIYPRRTYGDDLYALEIIDGSTIKVLRDNTGGRPQPPQPAFQQLLWGFPRGEFVADTDERGDILNGYRSDHLIYKRRNVRTFTQYGYSAVEQALEDIDVWLRRRKWVRDEYTEGTLPAAFIRNDGTSGWTAEQILDYERTLNDTFGGSSAERHRWRVLPPGFVADTFGDVAERYKPEYDLYLIKLVASHFDTTLAELGFTEQGGLGSAGWHEGQADVQHRKGTLPTLRWLQQLITSISRKHLGMPPELEFRFLGLEEEDEAAADQVAQQRIQWGRMTLNEDRDRLGQPRYPFPEADMPMVMTARGIVFLEGAAEAATPGVLLAPGAASQEDNNTDSDTGDGDGDGDGDDEQPEPAADGQPDAVKAELAAFHRWAKKNPRPRRPFTFEIVTKTDAPELAAAAVVFAGGDEAPKGELVAWPGWDRDQDTATVWSARIKSSLGRSVDCDALAERWLARELVKADEPDPAAVEQQQPEDDNTTEWAVALAVAFLVAEGIALTAPLATAVAGIWAEGWAIGNTAARAVLTRSRARYSWTIGNEEAARRTLTAAMSEALQAFTDRNRNTIPTITDRRLQTFARVLADAKTRGLTAKQLSQALRDVLQDDAWVRMVALTELTRASAEAARTAYTEAGVTRWRWATEPGACPVCEANAEAGPRVIGEAWPDGSAAPPAHPHCRCGVLPEISGL